MPSAWDKSMERQSSRCCLCRLYFRKRRAPEQALLTGAAPQKAAYLLHALFGSQPDRQRWIRAIWMQSSFKLSCKACQEMCCMLKCHKIKTGCNMAVKSRLSCCRLHSGRCAGHLKPAFHREAALGMDGVRPQNTCCIRVSSQH